jgi:hypothetical protein
LHDLDVEAEAQGLPWPDGATEAAEIQAIQAAVRREQEEYERLWLKARAFVVRWQRPLL